MRSLIGPQGGAPFLRTSQRAQEQGCLWVDAAGGAAQPLSVHGGAPPPPQVLNEVVIDRGPSSYLSNVDVYLDGHLITTVQGDGRWASGVSILRIPTGWGAAGGRGERPCGCPQA